MLSLAWKTLSIHLSALSTGGQSDDPGEMATAGTAGPTGLVGLGSDIAESVKTRGKPCTLGTYQGAPALKKPLAIFKCFSFFEAKRL